MRPVKTLRPELYRQLELARPEGAKISKHGLANQWSLRPREDGRMERFFDNSKGDSWGEYYRVCCPHCQDRKFRLSINHMWGFYDHVCDSKNIWLISCHHENCMKGWDQQWQFYRDTFSMIGGAAMPDMATPGTVQAREPGEMVWPGTVWPIDRLPEDSEARRYLEVERRFNIGYLESNFRVGVLLEGKPKFRHLHDRIVVPLFMDGKMVGWQARVPRKKLVEGEQKYWGMPGMVRGGLLYNYDSARRFPFVVVVEGPTDVWRFGPEAVACLGKPTSRQAQLLAANWKLVVILLDADAALESSALLKLLSNSVKVVEIRLPEGMDPGDFATSLELRTFVAIELNRQGVSLPAADPLGVNGV